MKIAAMLVGILIAGGHSAPPDTVKKNDSAYRNQNSATKGRRNNSGAAKAHPKDVPPTAAVPQPSPQVVPSALQSDTAHIESKIHGKKSEDTSEHSVSKRFSDNKDVVAGIVALLALLVSVLSYLGSRNNARIQLRAYIGYRQLTPMDDGLTLTAQNYGSTVARDVTLVAQFGFEQVSLTKIEALDDWIARDVLFPGQMLNFAFENWAPVGCQTFVYGKITYRDIFGNPQTTTFQYAVEGGTEIKNLRVWATSEGNTAT